jgi:uncharacterized protein (DUF2252 family)
MVTTSIAINQDLSAKTTPMGAFYRGAAKIMATDLRDTPRAGLNTQLCGDAHLSNFGGCPEVAAGGRSPGTSGHADASRECRDDTS